MDGYDDSVYDMKKLFSTQIKLNEEILSISKEMSSLPEFPNDVDKWIDSLADGNSKFKLADYKNIFSMNKRYTKIMEQREENSSKIKISIIDMMISRIKTVLGE